jgi:hypothetical protein
MKHLGDKGLELLCQKTCEKFARKVLGPMPHNPVRCARCKNDSEIAIKLKQKVPPHKGKCCKTVPFIAQFGCSSFYKFIQCALSRCPQTSTFPTSPELEKRRLRHFGFVP